MTFEHARLVMIAAVSACLAPACGKRYCPTGTDEVVHQAAAGKERYCTSDRGTRVGPYEFTGGHLVIHGTYVDGLADDQWIWDLRDPRSAPGKETRGYAWIRIRQYLRGVAHDQNDYYGHDAFRTRDGHEEDWGPRNMPYHLGDPEVKDETIEWDCGTVVSWSTFPSSKLPSYHEMRSPPPWPYRHPSAEAVANCRELKKVVVPYLRAHPLPPVP
jgi:hypothetical protein